MITLKPLTLENFADYEKLTQHGDSGQNCYCSFWHQKWSSMDEYHDVQKHDPERLIDSVRAKVRGGFHVGVIAYREEVPVAWISVGPLVDFFWAWRRVAQVGESARTVAGIICFTIAEEFRGQGLQHEVLSELKAYARACEWTALEAYPFSDAAIATHGAKLRWPGLSAGFERAGFVKSGPHWLNHPEYERFIYTYALENSK